MAEFQEKVDALGNETAHWEKELQALQEIVSKTKQIREELHKRDLSDLGFAQTLDIAKCFDGVEETVVKRIGGFLYHMSEFRDKLEKFRGDMEASFDDYEKICESIPVNTRFQELQKLEADLQKSLKSFQQEVQDTSEKWSKKYSDITGTRERFREIFDELSLEAKENMPSTQDAENINQDIEKLKEAVNRLELSSPVQEESGLRGQLTTIQNKMDNLSSPWDSELIDLVKRLGEKEKSLEQKLAKLEKFVQERDLELVWPQRGDEYSQEYHKILDEREDAQIGRGQVIQLVAPGLRRGTDVLIKAGIWLAK